MPGAHRPLIRPHRPDYVPADSRYVRTRTYRPRRVSRAVLGFLLGALIWAALSAAAVVLLHMHQPDTMPGRGVHPIPTPGRFTTMPTSMYKAPVIPGPTGARQAPIARTATAAARPGEPGHLERIFDQHAIGPRPAAVWRTADRWRDLVDR